MNARFAVAAFVLVASTVLAIVAPAVSAATRQAIPQRPRFDSTVSRVRVNVIVTDREGRFVNDLSADDFTVFEDGEPRDVLEVQLVDVVAGDVLSLTSPASAADPAEASTPDLAPAASDYGAMVFLIDFKGLDHTTKLHFTEQWERFLDVRDSTTVPQAVYLIDQVGRLREIVPLTSDLERLRAAQQTVEATPLTRAGVLSNDNPVASRFEEYDRSVYSLRLLAEFCEALSARPGRTALVWVSPGVTLKGPMDSDSRGLPRMSGTQYEPQQRILRLQEELYAAANSANVSIYAIDPSRRVDLGGAGSARDELGNSLRHAAAETGGKHYIGWADFGEVVEQIEADSGRYYLLIYPGPVPGGDGRHHAIRVEVDRSDVTVRSKEGYTDYSEEERYSRFVSAALMLPGTLDGIPVAAEVFRGAPGGGLTDALVAVAIDPEALGIGADDDGEPIHRVEVHGSLLDEGRNMEVAAEMHRQVTETLDGGVETHAAALLSKQEWRLRPGRYDLRIMVLDTVSRRVGTARLPVEIPEDEDDSWGIGDVVLSTIAGDDDLVPIVQGRVDAGTPVAAFIEVRGGQHPIVDGHLRLSTEDAGSSGGAELFAQPLRRDGGVHRGTLPLPPLAPGDYVLELRISDMGAGEARTIEVPLHVTEG